MRLENKVAVIIGATSGIGMATAELFTKEGASVIFCGRREEKGKEVEKELAQYGNAEFFQADVTSEEQCKALVDYVVDKYGRIDIFSNNAGVLYEDDFLEVDMEDHYDRLFNTNLRGPFRALQLVIQQMLKQENGGSIVNTASVGAVSTLPFNIPYSVSKAAMLHLTRNLAKTYADKGIRVNAICPGLTYSEMVEPGDDFDKAVLPNVPMGRGAQTEEIANAILFLASDESSYLTGQALIVDGGLSLN
ncbi:SDR family NAD(P)-dependent oxidoreductase [Hutsoniella sourekii]|uniref:SDR family NAD(P)-dependent oxidoreductase n=1 Tax=Hutsoniella sourekii TaxID=87650 RepID=UPI00048647E6|nr:SDR family oxidoreductase [Hutsoniella sourekii]